MNATDSAIDLDGICAIRKALIVGLASFGEIERLKNQYEINNAYGDNITEDMRPLHPTGNADTASKFATALALVDILEDERRQEGGAA